MFQYRLPKGWIDASNGEEAAKHALWLVRGDYAATMTIDQVSLDEDSRNLLLQRGIEPMAGLVQGLHQKPGFRGMNVAENLQVGGMDCVAFQQENAATGEICRTIVFADQGRLFETNAFAPKGGGTEIFSVQERVLETLKWQAILLSE